MGVVDQGGASVEMTFAPLDESWHEHDGLSHYTRHLTHNDKEYGVYAHSYLGYGINEARRVYHNMLIQQQREDSEGDEDPEGGTPFCST